MSVVVLGNEAALQSFDNGATWVEVDGPTSTQADIPEDYTLSQAFTAITHPQGVWAHHAVAGTTPTWVASDSEALAALLSDHFGDIEIRDLEV